MCLSTTAGNTSNMQVSGTWGPAWRNSGPGHCPVSWPNINLADRCPHICYHNTTTAVLQSWHGCFCFGSCLVFYWCSHRYLRFNMLAEASGLRDGALSVSVIFMCLWALQSDLGVNLLTCWSDRKWLLQVTLGSWGCLVLPIFFFSFWLHIIPSDHFHYVFKQKKRSEGALTFAHELLCVSKISPEISNSEFISES